jgi:hypothetical protein
MGQGREGMARWTPRPSRMPRTGCSRRAKETTRRAGEHSGQGVPQPLLRSSLPAAPLANADTHLSALRRETRCQGLGFASASSSLCLLGWPSRHRSPDRHRTKHTQRPLISATASPASSAPSWGRRLLRADLRRLSDSPAASRQGRRLSSARKRGCAHVSCPPGN